VGPLKTGARWKDLPDRYPPYQTCHRRFQQWVREGVLEQALHALATALLEQGRIDLSEAYIDGTFVPAKRGGAAVGPTKRGKGTKIMAVAERSGLPIALHIDSASPHEVTLVEETLAATFVGGLPERLIGDRAYDSDRLDEALQDGGVEMIAPHRRGRRKTQDGRRLRRYRRRWKVERLFAWLFCWRRLVVRYEYHPENFRGFVQLACALILLRRYGCDILSGRGMSESGSAACPFAG
jgi:transposase